MGLKLYLTAIFELLEWVLFGHIHHVFVTRHFMEHWGLLTERTPTIKSAKTLNKNSQNQISRLWTNEMCTFNCWDPLLFIEN